MIGRVCVKNKGKKVIIDRKLLLFRLFATAVGASTFFNLFLPVVIKNQNYWLLLCLRILQGLAEGMLYPTCHGIWSKWAPPLERSRYEVHVKLMKGRLKAPL